MGATAHRTPASGHEAGEPRVALLLSTYNGERYLSEQLASFATQTYANWRVYWRDDGSTDRTTDVMADFNAGPGAARVVVCSEGRRLGATGSFLWLLRTALQQPEAYFAFADQDDLWLPEKLAHGVTALRVLPDGQPALYFCARALADADLVRVGQVLAPNRPPGFPAALTQNLAPGCCMLLNRAAAELIAASDVPEGTWHDWWSYLVVSASGGTVIAGDTPDILYRQHGLNLIGEPRGFWHRTAGAARRGAGPFMTLFWRQVATLQAGSVPITDRARGQLAIIANSHDSGLLARLKALCLPGFVRQTRAETLLFRLWFLLG